MRIEMLRQTKIKTDLVRPGDKVEVDDRTARYLLALGKAVPAPAPARKPRKRKNKEAK